MSEAGTWAQMMRYDGIRMLLAGSVRILLPLSLGLEADLHSDEQWRCTRGVAHSMELTGAPRVTLLQLLGSTSRGIGSLLIRCCCSSGSAAPLLSSPLPGSGLTGCGFGVVAFGFGEGFDLFGR
jgi:hypothetical protein